MKDWEKAWFAGAVLAAVLGGIVLWIVMENT